MYCLNVNYKVALVFKELIMRQRINKVIHITIVAGEINVIRIPHVYHIRSNNVNDERYNVFMQYIKHHSLG